MIFIENYDFGHTYMAFHLVCLAMNNSLELFIVCVNQRDSEQYRRPEVEACNPCPQLSGLSMMEKGCMCIK